MAPSQTTASPLSSLFAVPPSTESGSVAVPNPAGSGGPAVAVERMAPALPGIEGFRGCVSGRAELLLSPPVEYEAKSAKALAQKLGFGEQSETPLQAFCEPELREELCAHADCVPGLALTWQMDSPRHGYGATGLLIVEEPIGRTRAYRAGRIDLWEQNFACHCMGNTEFARVRREPRDVVVVSYFTWTRPVQGCDEEHVTSTWLLDESGRPVAAVVMNGEPTAPDAIEVQRLENLVRVRIPELCEASVAWSELNTAADQAASERAAEQRAHEIKARERSLRGDFGRSQRK